MAEAPLEVVATSSFSSKLARVGPRRLKMIGQLLLSSYVPPHEWVHPSVDTVVPGPKGAQEIIDYWSPFNKRESSVTHMRDLYPTLLRVPMAACVKQYSIPFRSHMDREIFQRVAKDEILIRNHDFHQSAKLVSFYF